MESALETGPAHRSALPHGGGRREARRPHVHAQRAGARRVRGACRRCVAWRCARPRPPPATREIEARGRRTSTTAPPRRRSTAATSSAWIPTRTCCGPRCTGKRVARASLRLVLSRVRGAAPGRRGRDTEWTARRGLRAVRRRATGLTVRAGKQRVAWGSGFAWNPTNRLEPPKNPLNAGLEQEGAHRGARGLGARARGRA